MPSQRPVDIGSNRQLFLDCLLIDNLNGAKRKLHSPIRREPILVGDKPWDKASVAYMSIIEDGDLYRGYYRCYHSTDVPNPRHTAYAESRDGVHWTKPNLGQFEFEGSTENNLIYLGPGANFCAFIDGNPATPPDQRYKAVVRTGRAEGETLGAPGPCVLALASDDGIHWRRIGDGPILTDGPFDSFNVAFWDEWNSQYVIYTRGAGGVDGNGRFFGGVRWIRRATSKDFLNWSDLELIDTGEFPTEHLYTNACAPYERAPGVYLMFPSRYVIERTPDPDWPNGPGVNDIPLMSSRDGITWDRSFRDAFIRPGLDQENWHERGIYVERGLIQTSPETLSLYVSDHWRYPTTRISRYELRTDGFASVNAGYRGGEFVTRPLLFEGSELEINYSTSAVGSLRVELLDANGQALPGFALSDFPELYGDKIAQRVSWTNGPDVSVFSGKPARLRFVLKDADLYSFKFN